MLNAASLFSKTLAIITENSFEAKDHLDPEAIKEDMKSII